jgi:cyclopropane fatty-acyl-phospholipid synthase-like methyltransferase
MHKTFTNQDVENYYDQTEIHYRMFWRLNESLGLHYGIWDKHVKTLKDAVWNTNQRLLDLGGIRTTDRVLDAGCGVGGSSIFLAQKVGCKVTGITLSKKQVQTATAFARQRGMAHLITFLQADYTKTDFADHTFDIVWAIESMQTAPDKAAFFREMQRILKPGGKILIADCFKTYDFDIAKEKAMQTMLHGWAMSDLLTISELEQIVGNHNFVKIAHQNVTGEIQPSVRRIYLAAILGFFGTKWYNLFRNASYFSKIHYKTGLAQYHTYRTNQWGYHLMVLEKTASNFRP